MIIGEVFKILLIVVIAGLLMAAFFWWQHPQFFSKKLPIKDFSVLGETTPHKTPSKNSPENLLTSTTNLAEQLSQNLTNNLIDDTKNTLYKRTQSVLDTAFNKTPSENKVSVLVNPPTVMVDRVTILDFTKNNNLQIKLSRNNKYQLKFQNTPPNFCLYIDQNNYPIDDGKILEIQFINSGNYLIKANLCNLQDKTIGTITVE